MTCKPFVVLRKGDGEKKDRQKRWSTQRFSFFIITIKTFNLGTSVMTQQDAWKCQHPIWIPIKLPAEGRGKQWRMTPLLGTLHPNGTTAAIWGVHQMSLVEVEECIKLNTDITISPKYYETCLYAIHFFWTINTKTCK